MRLRSLLPAFVAVLALAACADPAPRPSTAVEPVSLDTEPTAEADTAVFAGGCFWCMEPPYEKLDGVFSVVSGYAGGTTPDPTYQQVANGRTDHAEVVRVIYDPEVISYETLLEVFWHNIDPFAVARQFCDRGEQYRSGIYPRNAEQQRTAEASKEAVMMQFNLLDQAVTTEIKPLDRFYPAEDYHQDFYRKNPTRYYSYRAGCRRDARLEEIWGEQAGKPGPLG